MPCRLKVSIHVRTRPRNDPVGDVGPLRASLLRRNLEPPVTIFNERGADLPISGEAHHERGLPYRQLILFGVPQHARSCPQVPTSFSISSCSAACASPGAINSLPIHLVVVGVPHVLFLPDQPAVQPVADDVLDPHQLRVLAVAVVDGALVNSSVIW